MNFLVAPPEVISARMYAGAGPAPMLTAATAWEGLAAELGSAASAFSSVTSDLTASCWQGPASAAMAAVAAPYAQWLDAAATRAVGAAIQAKAVAALYEAARSAVVHPVAVAANRHHLLSLVFSNLLGFNAPAIAADECEYEEMWARDVSAMVGYHGGASAVAAQLVPWQQALQTLPGQVTATAGASPVAPTQLGAAAAANPAATLIEYALIASLLQTGVMVAMANLGKGVETTFAAVSGAIEPAAKAIATGATAVAAPVVKALAESPVVAAATAAIAPVATQVATAVTVAANTATAAVAPVAAQVASAVTGVAGTAAAVVGQVASAATTQVGAAITAIQTAGAGLAQQLTAALGDPSLLAPLLTSALGDPAVLANAVTSALANPALLTDLVTLFAGNPALATNLFGLLAANPQLVATLVSQVENNPALLAALMTAFSQLQASNPALAAQVMSLAEQLASQLGIGQAA